MPSEVLANTGVITSPGTEIVEDEANILDLENNSTTDIMSIIEEADIVILDDKVNFENDAIGIVRELDVPNFSTDISTDGTISFQLNEVNIMQRVSNQIFVDDFEMSNIIGNNQEMDLEENVNLESNVNKPLYEENQSLESNDTQIDDGVSKDNLQNDTNRHSYAKYGINENAFNTNTQRESDEGDPLYEFSGEENESLSSNDTRIDNQVHKDDLQDDKLKQKRSTKYKVDKNKWNVNTNRFNREKGKSYAGKKQENGVWKYDLVKGPRMLKINCNCKLSKNKNYKLQCRQLEEDTRKEIFEQFWNYTWKEKKYL